MKGKLATTKIVATMVVAGVGVGALILQSAWADEDAVTAASAVVAITQGPADHEYVGVTKCKACHIKEYKSWEETNMAKSLETLKPGVKAESKTKVGLDPEKDYSKDESCLPCHVVGHGHAGGYELVDDEKKQNRIDKKLGSVGCESCHGPGEEYVKLFQEIQRKQEPYKLADLQAAGLILPNPESCKECHNDKSPTHELDQLGEWDGKSRTGLHELQELKLRGS